MRHQTYKTTIVFVVLVVAIGLMTYDAAAQRIPCRVVLRDKGASAFVPGSPTYDSVLTTFHPRALARRAMVGMDPLLDSLDRPIDPGYRQQVVSVSDSLLAELNWFNTLIVGLTTGEQEQVRSLPFVASVTPCSTVAYTQQDLRSCEPPDPGRARDQLRLAGTQDLHDAGVYGTGVRVGMIDNGFRWRSMSSLADVKIAGEYDVVHQDSNTANEAVDPGSQDGHGSSILSIIAGWMPDTLVGVAPFSTYLLAKSEDMRYERRIEEDLYVAAITWLERQGADISSSSLGYRYFDSTDANTPYSAFDGATTFPSRAINIAATRGLICMTAAGNYGPFMESLVTPGDADSAVTVGAVTMSGSWWAQSSWGPTAAGKLKPDFTAMGASTVSQNPWGEFISSSGTSNATPIVAGQFALLRELYPNAEPWALRDAARRASQNPETRDSTTGHGTFDVAAAARLLGPGVGPPASVIVDGQRTLIVAVFASAPVAVRVELRDPETGATATLPASPVSGDWYRCTIPADVLPGQTVEVRIVAMNVNEPRTGSYPRDTSWLTLDRTAIVIPCGMRLPSTITSVNDDVVSPDGVMIADHPLASGTRELYVVGRISPPTAVRLVRVGSGEVVTCRFSMSSSSSIRVDLPMPLAAGAWIVVLDDGRATVGLPLLQR